jgi:hypothetical protein
MTSNATLLSFNGINGRTGDYLVPDQTIDQLVDAAIGETIDPGLRAELRDKTRQTAEGHFGVRFGHDASPTAVVTTIALARS